MIKQRLDVLQKSLIYYLKDILHEEDCNTIDEGDQANLYRAEVPYFVRVMDHFPDATLETVVLPSVALTYRTSTERPFQLGGGYEQNPVFNIDVFGRTKSEKDNISYLLYESLEAPCSLLDYRPDKFPTYYLLGGKLVKQYPNGVPPAMSIMDFIDRKHEAVTGLKTVGNIDTHRALITVEVSIYR